MLWLSTWASLVVTEHQQTRDTALRGDVSILVGDDRGN
jgi:hypothetical protein